MNQPAINTSAAISRKVSLAAELKPLPRYIAVEGPIGVGKTTLAQLLAEAFRYPLLVEPVTENPFLDRFYEEGNQHALPTQLFFLLHRARQISDLSQYDLLGPTLVADFLMEKDRLFAKLTLDEEEYELYEQIHKNLALRPPVPDLVIYLQAPADILQQRIQGRGINFEQHIEMDYLRALADTYTEFFHYYDAAPLLIVNAAEIDFAHNQNHFEALLDQLFHMDGNRQFFNPNPTLI
ncbi:MAG: deoxynucleoside kinase [Gammaproteobacteria bacterium]|nr:deoxynucleoside kinase [Gammaproteobacteria bacterium]